MTSKWCPAKNWNVLQKIWLCRTPCLAKKKSFRNVCRHTETTRPMGLILLIFNVDTSYLVCILLLGIQIVVFCQWPWDDLEMTLTHKKSPKIWVPRLRDPKTWFNMLIYHLSKSWIITWMAKIIYLKERMWLVDFQGQQIPRH